MIWPCQPPIMHAGVASRDRSSDPVNVWRDSRDSRRRDFLLRDDETPERITGMLHRTRVSEMRQMGARVTWLLASSVARTPNRLMERTRVVQLSRFMG